MYRKTKAEIARYSSFVSKKALEGDEIAINILKKSGRDLANTVIKLRRNLNLKNDFVLGFVGGFIKFAPFVKEELVDTLKAAGLNPIIIKDSNDPVYGAYYMAKRKGKI
jgi:N-acetylglucosamine kinase-like BadF-type ATPase